MATLGIQSNPEAQPTWELSLGEFLEDAVSRNPDKVFLQIVGQEITYRQFYARVRQAAGMFRELGINHGDRVCLFLPNVPEFHYCWFGLSLLGAISVPVNIAYRRDETAYIFDNAEAAAVVAHNSLVEVAEAAARISPSVKRKLLVTTALESEAGQPAPPNSASKADDEGWLDFAKTMAASGELPGLPAVAPDDIAMLVYTSGTTGNPKGVQVTHLMYVAAGQGFAHWTEASAEDRFFTCLPFFHANAQYYSTMGTLAAGATLVVAERFSASRFWEQVRQADATVVNFIGMMMPVLAKQPESDLDLRNNVRLFYGSPAFSPEFLEAFQERFDTDIIVGFGMTETCYGAIEKIGQARRPNSSGQPRLHPDPGFINHIRIVADDGNPVATGQPGEIAISNPAVMPGYWRNQEQTDLALKDGWLHTGDLGWLDDEGFLYFVDRKKDVIRRRGENISSQEVEDVIKRHPTVLDCAVIAVPSELGEDEVKAYITPRPPAAVDEETIVLWCAENLAYFKVPRYIEVRVELPRTPSLRVRKDLLRQEREDLISGCFDREAAGIRIR
jgi:crotonobetaine/carnitine-CoA ligase